MANAREIQGRIKSIKDTMKITNAMYMVSSSKLQKARRDLKNTEPYFYMIQDSLAKILDVAPEVGSVYFDERPNKVGDDRIVAYLVITADKGLAGAYNHNVIKLAEKCTVDDGCNNMLFVVGQLGRHFFEKKEIPIDINFRYAAQNPTVNRARHISEKIVSMFLDKKIDEVHVVYTKMVNSMTVEAVSTQLLPLKKGSINMQSNELVEHYNDAVFMPDVKTAFDSIVPSYIAGFVYGALVESYCSEHNARMMAMQNASDSANSMIKDLSIQFNRARQAAITQEISEVCGGASHAAQEAQ
ncbi:ATP synthase F1 subunit gamma [Eubacterium coprostanoligenes]|uniref:ATP synthase gamma chain n=1 Tax=Eubacterium coprostanoligenes TaxID=290054 RepID=A0A1T4MV02_9FIRM|nr:ATP synthase F1 subunit gamma [Eubacterium coprostanoligenes]MCI6354726.1 ATP synthase F1 subunit gamma [Eubacterium coprostanoligenes]MCI7265352.1 ATP synthase F1 subunit gamma [Eubacterium coprostanoligenes]MDD6665974.1 ATP synthase F1 subunit gamma [Eubacterium coprostanoligenes]MDD7358301.1 ATP synthase F1 subunit gamma [Eubacterium coprostanoligenes]MDY4698095.1 ATP synthase F1 subunit gamma [Eubacterium coprostanoligenes]